MSDNRDSWFLTQIEMLQEEVLKLQEDRDLQELNIASLLTTIGSLEKDRSEAVEKLEGTVTDLNIELNDMQHTIDDLRADLHWQEDRVNELLDQLEDRDDSIRSLQNQLDTVTFALANANDTIAMLQRGF